VAGLIKKTVVVSLTVLATLAIIYVSPAAIAALAGLVMGALLGPTLGPASAAAAADLDPWAPVVLIVAIGIVMMLVRDGRRDRR
jgi:hypothetical protein